MKVFLTPGTYAIHCKKCGIPFIAVIAEEDIADGCREGTLSCPQCLDVRFAGVDADVIRAAAKTVR